ncbi:response regulator [Clostridiaceae bacterium DONG20-135]|uniref:Response regulator n=1 Tax=Copranaerobaculum intestinale TaxID=2692629 RepID=A0A6N8UAV2_9FIRM|nr:response regulator transcription factor [Copranaerobaculum intestinale]MXQ74464.1 response regulator [Copranaerobaculum intestinale]
MRIIIIDDDHLVLNSLKMILEAQSDIEVVAIGDDGEQAISLYQQYHPDVLLMDIRMQKVNGLEASMAILKADSQARILLLTTFNDDEYIVQALRLGVKGYILKQNYDVIYPALKAVCQNQRVFNDEIMMKLPDLMKRSDHPDYEKWQLSDKEQELIIQVANGASNREIANNLCLSEGTVRNYLSVIMEKVQVRDRTQLAIFYYQHMWKQ